MNRDLLRDLLREALEQQLIAVRTCMDALAPNGESAVGGKSDAESHDVGGLRKKKPTRGKSGSKKTSKKRKKKPTRGKSGSKKTSKKTPAVQTLSGEQPPDTDRMNVLERGELIYSDSTWNGLRHLASLAGDREILGIFERMEERWRDPDSHVQLLDSLRTWAVVRGLGFHHTERGFKVHDAAVPEGDLFDRARVVLSQLKSKLNKIYLTLLLDSMAKGERVHIDDVAKKLYGGDPVQFAEALRKQRERLNEKLLHEHLEIREAADGFLCLASMEPPGTLDR